MSPEIRLERNRHGRLCVQLADGTRHDTVTPVRAFPLEAPLEAISLVGPDGKEVCWIEHLDHLSADQRALLEEDFAVREFVPVVQRIEAIDAISVPSVWTVMTDKGRTTLTLRAEEDIRKLKGQHQLLIASRDGVQYLIPDARQLDRQSHKFLELFL